MIQIDENIRKYRRKKGLSQQDLADIIGVSHQAISKWERGENYPDLLSLVSLSQFFEVDINHLVYKEWENLFVQLIVAEMLLMVAGRKSNNRLN